MRKMTIGRRECDSLWSIKNEPQKQNEINKSENSLKKMRKKEKE